MSIASIRSRNRYQIMGLYDEDTGFFDVNFLVFGYDTETAEADD